MSWGTFQPLLLRCYRAGVLVVVAWLIRDQHLWFLAQQGDALQVGAVRDFFPTASKLGPRDPSNGVQRVFDDVGAALGLVTQTAPLSDTILGYCGPTNTLMACDIQGRVIGLRVLHSDDTPEHIAQVIRERRFFEAFRGARLGDATTHPKVDAVSGATLTSTAIAEGVLQRLGQQGGSLRFPDAITLEEVKAIVPEAAVLQMESPRVEGLFLVLDSQGRKVALVTRTSPVSDHVIGYKGPSDTLVVLNAEGTKVVGIHVRRSYDTKEYVGYVTGDRYFMSLFNGMGVKELGELDFAKAKIEGVSGATETSWSIAESLKRRARTIAPPQGSSDWKVPLAMKASDLGLLSVIVLSLAMTFTPLRGFRWARFAHHALLIGYAGLFSGAMLSQGLFIGWAQHGAPWQGAPVLVLLAALALMLPVATRRQFYCHHYCPHGALQQALARRLRWQFHPSGALGRCLGRLPWALLVLAVGTTMMGLGLNVNALEPFDAWLLRVDMSSPVPRVVVVAGLATIGIAVVGVVASLFVPMAYCRYGCPTGALLRFVRYAGHGDGFGRRDFAAALLVFLAVFLRYAIRG